LQYNVTLVTTIIKRYQRCQGAYHTFPPPRTQDQSDIALIDKMVKSMLVCIQGYILFARNSRKVSTLKWIMLIYKLPRSRTTAIKVATWRKLKKLGVFSVQDSVCVLPHSEKTLENLEWLAAELRELGGEASVWEAQALTSEQERELKNYFIEQANTQYREIIQESPLARDGRHLQQLWTRYNIVKAQDYLKSPLAAEARAACENRALELRKEEEKV
jgi:hypothetical protein